MKMNDAICRPEEITSDAIWELYKLLEGLERRYMWIDMLETAEKKEKLMYLDLVALGEDGVIYDVIDDIEIADCKNEWVELVLKNIENGKAKRYSCKIKINALHNPAVSSNELLKRNNLRIADVSDMENVVFEQEKSCDDEQEPMIPVNDYTVSVRRELVKRGRKAAAMARDFKDYLRSFNIPYKEDVDMGAKRFTFVFMCDNAPGGFVEGCIWFFDKAAEMRVYYNSIGADICKKSECRNELLRLLNFINARVFMGCFDGGNRMFDSSILHTPRIYLTEDEGFDISITTMINYDFWKMARYETHDYITAYCPELLDRLAPYIYGMLKNNLSIMEAISGIKTDLLDGN